MRTVNATPLAVHAALTLTLALAAGAAHAQTPTPARVLVEVDEVEAAPSDVRVALRGAGQTVIAFCRAGLHRPCSMDVPPGRYSLEVASVPNPRTLDVPAGGTTLRVCARVPRSSAIADFGAVAIVAAIAGTALALGGVYGILLPQDQNWPAGIALTTVGSATLVSALVFGVASSVARAHRAIGFEILGARAPRALELGVGLAAGSQGVALSLSTAF